MQCVSLWLNKGKKERGVFFLREIAGCNKSNTVEILHFFTGICECTDKFCKITGSVNEPNSSYPEMHYLYFFWNLCVNGA